MFFIYLKPSKEPKKKSTGFTNKEKVCFYIMILIVISIDALV